MVMLAIKGGKPVRNEPYKIMPSIGKEESTEIQKVMESKFIAEFDGAHRVTDFEKAFSEYLGVEYSVALNSGTSALHVAFSSVGIESGDEVIVPAFTFVASVSPLIQIGAKPIFADISMDNYCLNSSDVEKVVNRKSKAILPVHLYGNVTEMSEIIDIAREYKLKIIEDACQAHGSIYKKIKAGALGDVGCFSFAIGKNLTTGEGGMIATNDNSIASISRLLRQNGKADWRTHVMLGYNYRMTDLSASIGLAQLKKLDRMNEIRRRYAEIYREELEETGFILPHVADYVKHVYYKFPILMPEKFLDKRDWFVNAVRMENVPIEEGYPYPLYEIGFLQRYKRKCPITENVTRRIVNLYTTPSVTEDVIYQTCEAIKKVASFL